MDFKIFVFTVICVASASCVKLENLCASDHFIYKGVLVNAFHRVPRNVTFEGLNHYLIHDTVKCDHSQFKNESNWWEAMKAKQTYNRKFSEYYAESLTNATPKEIQAKSWNLMLFGWIPLVDLEAEEDNVRCLKSFQLISYSGQSVFETLERFVIEHKNAVKFEAAYKPRTSVAVKRLQKWMDELKNDAEGQTFAMASESAWDIYSNKSIVLPKEFKFLTKGSEPIGPETRTMLTYVEFLPFNSPHKPHNDEACVPASELPLFYKNKGVDKYED